MKQLVTGQIGYIDDYSVLQKNCSRLPFSVLFFILGTKADETNNRKIFGAKLLTTQRSWDSASQQISSTYVS